MKTLGLVSILLFGVLAISPLSGQNSSLFPTGIENHPPAFLPLLSTPAKDRPFNFDIAKTYYMPYVWNTWYQLNQVGCIEMNDEDMVGGNWIPAHNTVVLRAEGKPVSATIFDYTETPAETYRYEYTYSANSQNQPATIMGYTISDEQIMLDSRQNYSYNAYGGLTHVTNEIYNNGAWVLTGQADYESTQDQLIQVTEQFYNNYQMTWENLMHMEISWAGNHVNELVKQYWIGGAWQNSDRFLFSYTIADEIYRVVHENWNQNPGLWENNSRVTYTFVDGLWTEELIEDYSSSLGWLPDWKGILTWNNNDRPLQQLGYEWINNAWETSERLTFSYDTTAAPDDNALPAPLLLSNYPNPFTANTTVAYKLPQAAQTELAIYNTRGQLVCQLLDEPQSSGQHCLNWDGKDGQGQALPAGMYLCRIFSAGRQSTRKLLLLK